MKENTKPQKITYNEILVIYLPNKRSDVVRVNNTTRFMLSDPPKVKYY